MYEFILKERLATVIVILLLAMLISSLVGAGSLWLKGLVYNFSPAMAASFYAVAFLATPQPKSVDLIAGLLFELTVLALFFKLFLNIKKSIVQICEADAARVLKWALLFQLLISFPNMNTAGFGLFSEGSRIDYLSSNSIAKYWTYAGLLISTVQAVFLASLVTSRGNIGILGCSVIAANFVLSVLAGSKGGVFLWLLSMASLIEYKRAKIQTYQIIITLMIVMASVWISSIIIAQFLNLEINDFIDLASSRFFLSNDARALSFDLRTSQTADFSFFSEAFRSLGNLIGLPPKNDPLGVVLYGEGLSIINGSGANTSFMALATYYFPIGYTLIPALLGILGLIIVVGVAWITAMLLVSPATRLMATSIWMACLLTYSQDFLAFQVLLPIAVLVIFGIWIVRRRFNDFPIKTQYVKF